MTVAAALAAVPALVATATEEQSCPVFPTPQQYEISARQTVKAGAVSVQTRTPESAGGLWDRIPVGVEGAYAISISPEGAVQVLANDATGVFYAKQTLSQMLIKVPGARNAQKDPFPELSLEQVATLGELPTGTVVDWPSLRYRGAVEGYYGIPWSYDGRRSLFDFYGRNKMNIYIYAPKDDPLHHGKGCYEPYPEEKAHELAALVKHARRNHVRFVWAIHPANTVKWDENEGRTQLDGLCSKLQWMYDLGVRDFAVLVDDSFGEIGKASRQVQLCNYILENFIRKHPDVNQELIMCPTGYNKSWAQESELKTLGEGLDKDIHIMWTGNTVVNDITLEGQKWVNERTGRPTFIWWNWPCNDMKPSRLSMGRTYGLDQTPGMEKEMSGFVANPMERPEANKVGLFGVAAYTWNIPAFDSEPTWKEGIRRLYPQCAEAMQIFCEHNADLLPNGHGYAREESVSILPLATQFRAELAAGEPNPETFAQLSDRFAEIAAAGHNLIQARGIQPLQSEIAPWLRAFALTGQAGVEVIRAMRADRLQERLSTTLHVVDSLSEMSQLYRDAWQDNAVVQIQDIQVGSHIVTPALRSAFNYVNAAILSELAGRNIRTMMPAFSCNGGDATVNAANVGDGNLNSLWESGKEQQAGDWYCLDLGELTPVSTINLRMGGNTRRRWVPQSGQMEYSADGQTWSPLGELVYGPKVTVDRRENPVMARMVRYRIVQPTEKMPLAICEFTVNRPLPALLSTSIQGLAGIYAYNDETTIGLSRKMEVVTAAPGSYLSLNLPIPAYAISFTLDLDDPTADQWCRLELTLEDGSVVTPKLTKLYDKYLMIEEENMPKQGIRCVRMLNAGNKSQEIRLNSFSLRLPYVAPDTDVHRLTDGDISTAFNCGKSALRTELNVPAGASRMSVITTADCTVSNATPTGRMDGLMSFELQPGTSKVTLEAPRQPGMRVYEVIFR